MRKERQRGLAIAGGIVALAALAAACMGKPDLPPFVASGNLGGEGIGGGGGATAVVDSGIDDDTGIGDEAGTGTTLTTNESCLASNGTCLELLAASSTSAPTCVGTISSVACPTTNITGCCAISDSFGNDLQTCYYNSSTAAGASQASCSSLSGSFSATPNPL